MVWTPGRSRPDSGWDREDRPELPERQEREYQDDFVTPEYEVDGASVVLRPDAVVVDHQTAFTLGPVAISDPSGGLVACVWRVRLVGQEVHVCRANASGNGWQPETVLFSIDDGLGPVTELDFAFEQTGNPVVCCERPTGEGGASEIWIYFYDATVPGNVFRNFGAGRTPRAILDRPLEIADSDVEVFYISDSKGRIVYRQQRDRYEVEIDTPAGRKYVFHRVNPGWYFADEFERAEIGQDWVVKGGEWSVGPANLFCGSGGGSILLDAVGLHREVAVHYEMHLGSPPQTQEPPPKIFISYDPETDTGYIAVGAYEQLYYPDVGETWIKPKEQYFHRENGVDTLLYEKELPPQRGFSWTYRRKVVVRDGGFDLYSTWTQTAGDGELLFSTASDLPPAHHGRIYLENGFLGWSYVEAWPGNRVIVEEVPDQVEVVGGWGDTAVDGSSVTLDMGPETSGLAELRLVDPGGFELAVLDVVDSPIRGGETLVVAESDAMFVEDVAKLQDRRVAVFYSIRDASKGQYTLHALVSALPQMTVGEERVATEYLIAGLSIQEVVIPSTMSAEKLDTTYSLPGVVLREPVIIYDAIAGKVLTAYALDSVDLLDATIVYNDVLEAMNTTYSLADVAMVIAFNVDRVANPEAMDTAYLLNSVVLEAV